MKNVCENNGIHVKIKNMKSDKRLQWMCLEGDFGAVFGCILIMGAYSHENH